MGKAIRTSPRTRPGEPGLAGVPAAPGQANKAASCAAEGARSLPFDVRPATSLMKTGRGEPPRPWSVNLEGKGPWVAARAEATTVAENASARGRPSFDIAGVPVTRRWHGENRASVAQAFDLLAASSAARGPKALQAEAGGPPKAAGALPSRAPEQAVRRHGAFGVPPTAGQTGPASGCGGGPDGGPAAPASAELAAPRVAACPRPSGGGPRPGSLVPLGG